MDTNKKILVVDDEKKIVDVIVSYLEHNNFDVKYCINGNEALEYFNKYNFDLIILDLMLPDISGEDVCRVIRKTSKVPIIMLTAKVDEFNILEGLNIGADDYITKPFSPKELVARVFAILRRVSSKEEPLMNVFDFNNGELIVDTIKFEVVKNNKIINLTPNEFKILKILVMYPKKTFTRDELISTALGNDFLGYDRTIDSHIKNLRHKIEDDPKIPKYIKTIYGVGYRFGLN